MGKKNILILSIILLILLLVGSFFLIKLMQGRVYDRVTDPTVMATGSYIDVLESPQRPVLTTTSEPITPAPQGETQSEPTAAIDQAKLTNMDQIEAQVVQLRGLDSSTRIPRQIMSSAALKETVLNDFLEEFEPEDERKDVAILNLFGLLPQDFALREFYVELYSEQIAGFYDTEEKEMYVVSDVGFGGMERSTYAHEFVHVLQDEHFNFDEKLQFSDEYCEQDSERCAAIQALIEGDATLTQAIWFQTYATKKDIQDLQAFYTTFKSPILDNAPEYMKVDFTFPYVYGAQFVQSLYAQNGFQLIDQAFETAHPVSTEQILHPLKYPTDLPNNPDLPDLAKSLGEGWEMVDENVLGEWYTYLILAKGFQSGYRLHDTIALDAAEGWGGDRYAVLFNSNKGEYAATVSYNWDTAEDAAAALDAFGKYSDLRFGPIKANYWQSTDLFASLHQTSETSFVWILAESMESLSAMQAILHN